MILQYSDWMLIILAISGLSSFWSSKIGILTCWLITISSIAFTALFMIGGVPGVETFLFLGLLLFPALSWLGFLAGKHLKKKSEAKLDRNQDPK